jgi:hypothetical protein
VGLAGRCNPGGADGYERERPDEGKHGGFSKAPPRERVRGPLSLGNRPIPSKSEAALLKRIRASMKGLSRPENDRDFDDFMPEIGVDEAWLYHPHKT